MSDIFRLSTSNVLGFDYENYISKITSFAMSSPSQYYDMRRQVLKEVKHSAVANLYNIIFEILSKGKVGGNTAIQNLGSGDFVPNYPSPKINDICLKIAAVLASELDQVVEIILPHSFDKLSAGALSLKGRASIIDSA